MNRSLQEWVFLPSQDFERVHFGPCELMLKLEKMDIPTGQHLDCDQQWEVMYARNRSVVNVGYVKVEEHERQKGIFKRSLELLAVMMPVDYVVVSHIMSGIVQDYCHRNGWTEIPVNSAAGEAPAYASKPRAILNIETF